MATTVTKTIKSSGGDYTSLSAWEAANQGDLVAADEVRQAECYAFEDTTAVTIDGSTVDSTRYMRVFAAAGAEAQMPWNTSTSYRLRVLNTALNIQDDYVRVERIQVEFTSNASGNRYAVQVNGVNGVRLIGVLARNAGADANNVVFSLTGISSGNTVYAINCVAIGAANGDNGFQFFPTGTGAALLYNCTAVNCATGFYNASSPGAIAKNCLSYGNVTADFGDGGGGWAAGTEFNASEDATAPGTSSRTSQTFTFVNTAGGDYHLDSGDGGAKDFGKDLSADAAFPFSDDFDGVARSGSWDIGADEIVSAAAGLSAGVIKKLKARRRAA